MFGTYSRFITLPEERKRELAERIGAEVRAHAPTRDGQVLMPMVCYCWRARLTAR
jgi:hypothetical protein